MNLLIDGDIIVYRAAFAAQHKDKETGELSVDDVAIAIYNAREMLKRIMLKLGTRLKNLIVCLTDSQDETNFRKVLEPTYKANRKDIERPVHYDAVRDLLQYEFDATVIRGAEADDLLCMLQYTLDPQFDKSAYNSVIVSIDKDLDQVPGWHYNFVKDDMYYQTKAEAFRCFYKQILVGDAADNIPRIKERWRSKDAFEELDAAKYQLDMIEIVVRTVHLVLGEELTEREQLLLIRKRANLLWLKRYEDDVWDFPPNHFGYEMLPRAI